jgi:hypothetical protein
MLFSMSVRTPKGSRRSLNFGLGKSLGFLIAATACGGATASSDGSDTGGGASTAGACMPVGNNFRSQFTAGNCDVVARVNADATQILGYRVVCGNEQTVSIESLKAELLPSARVSWFDSISYGSSSDAAYLFVHSSDPYDVIAFGVKTGLTLFEFSGSNTPPMFGDWSPESDINGDCRGPIPAFTSLGPWDASDPGQEVLGFVYEKGLIDGVNAVAGGYRNISLVRANLPTLEYLVILSTKL